MITKKIEKVVALLEEIGIVPVIKLDNTLNAVPLAKALISGGINCAEVTFRAKGADKVIKDILAAYPNMVVGAGTVLTLEHAKSAVESGAMFIVAPGFNPKIAEYVLSQGVPFIPGVSSPSEIEAVMELGLRHVKFFPAEQAGGLEYIKAISAPYPDMRFMPTGGISETNIVSYLKNSKIFACGGSWMVAADLIRDEKWEEITKLASAAMAKVLGFEIAHVGINAATEDEAKGVATLFGAAFGFERKEGKSSYFVSSGIEVMKTKYFGDMGHIAIGTNSLKRATRYVESRGFEVDSSTLKVDDRGNPVAIYLTKSFGGFAVHLVEKK